MTIGQSYKGTRGLDKLYVCVFYIFLIFFLYFEGFLFYGFYKNSPFYAPVKRNMFDKTDL